MTAEDREPLISTKVLDAAITPRRDIRQLQLVSIWQGDPTRPIAQPTEVAPIDWHVGRSGRHYRSDWRPEALTATTGTAVRELWPDSPDQSATGTVTTLEFDRIPDDLEAVLQSWLMASRSAGAAFSCFVFADAIDPRSPLTTWSPSAIYGYLAGGVIALAVDDGYRSGTVWQKRVEAAVSSGVSSSDSLVQSADGRSVLDDDPTRRLLRSEICWTGTTTTLELVTLWPDLDPGVLVAPLNVTPLSRALSGPLWEPGFDLPFAAIATTLEFSSMPDDLPAVLVAWLRAARSAGAVLALFVFAEMSEENALRPLVGVRSELPRLDWVYAFASGCAVTLALDDERRHTSEWSRTVDDAALLAVPLPPHRMQNNADEGLLSLVIRGNTDLQASDDDACDTWYPEPAPLGWRLENIGFEISDRSPAIEQSEVEQIKSIMHRLWSGDFRFDVQDGAGRFFEMLWTSTS